MTNEWVVRRAPTLFLILCVLVIHHGCARTFSGRLVDTENQPVRGALVYIEAYTDHTYSFAWSVSGDSGEVPARGQPRLKLSMRPGAKMMYCVLAPEQYPFIVNDREKVFRAGTLSFEIPKQPLAGLAYNPLLFHLDFPFENSPALRKKLMLSENRILVETFYRWYQDAQATAPGLGPAAMRKIEALDSLLSAHE